jgi:hypothetical protein
LNSVRVLTLYYYYYYYYYSHSVRVLTLYYYYYSDSVRVLTLYYCIIIIIVSALCRVCNWSCSWYAILSRVFLRVVAAVVLPLRGTLGSVCLFNHSKVNTVAIDVRNCE